MIIFIYSELQKIILTFWMIYIFSILYLDLKPRGIESPDLEKVMYENGICPTQAQLVAPFTVSKHLKSNLFENWHRHKFSICFPPTFEF